MSKRTTSNTASKPTSNATLSTASRAWAWRRPALCSGSVCRPTQLKPLLDVLRQTVASPSTADLELVKRLWAGAIVHPEDPQKRHSVTNLIGPRILLAGMRGFQQTGGSSAGPVAALERMMSALDLVRNTSEIERSPWFRYQKWGRVVDKFVLIDDMADLGWSEFVQEALRLRAGQLMVCTAPDCGGLGEDGSKTLHDLIADAGGLRVNQGLSLSGAGDVEVLLLDLRLFGQRPRAEERAFVGRLLPLAEGARDAGERELPWPGFGDDELEAVRRHVATGVIENDDYFIALTVLPRLLALVDPQLPIVLFSSTGRRAIVEPLSRYGNIILEFDKPRFFGDLSAAPVAGNARPFRRAMSRAIRILKGRELCRRLTSAAPQHTPPTPAWAIGGSSQTAPVAASPGPAVPPQTQEKKHIEIYIDESGSGRDVTVGGLAVVYPNESTAGSLSAVLRSTGSAWGLDEDCEPAIPTPHLHKRLRKQQYETREQHEQRERRYVHNKLRRVAEIVEGQGASIHAFRLEGPSQMPHRHSDRQSEANHLYRSLLQGAIEWLLFVWPAVRRNDATVSVYVATRIQVGSLTEVERWRSRFGYDFRPHGRERFRAFTFSAQDVLPIVDAIRSHRCRGDSVVASRGIQLVSYDDRHIAPPEDYRLPRQIHFAADWAVSFPESVPKTWWKGGFQDRMDGCFEHVLQASRMAEAPGRHVEALLEWGRVPPNRTDQTLSVARRVKDDLRHCVGALEGSEFVRLCELLARARHTPGGG